MRSGRPRGPGKALRNVGGETPRISEGFPGPPEPARPQKCTPKTRPDYFQEPSLEGRTRDTQSGHDDDGQAWCSAVPQRATPEHCQPDAYSRVTSWPAMLSQLYLRSKQNYSAGEPHMKICVHIRSVSLSFDSLAVAASRGAMTAKQWVLLKWLKCATSTHFHTFCLKTERLQRNRPSVTGNEQ